MTTRRSVVEVLAWLTLLAAACVLALGIFWLTFPYDPLTVHDVRLMNDTVKQGEVLALEVTYTKRMDLTGMGVRWFVDGISYATAPQPGRLPVGENQRIVREVVVPITLPPGEYHLNSIITFEVNPLRSVSYSYDSPPFTVLPAD